MQTFLPYAEFGLSAACLDNKRLGKQRAEGKQIYCSLIYGEGNIQLRHHPATLMWEGHERQLLFYIIEVCTQWRRRGFEDFVRDWAWSELTGNAEKLKTRGDMPSWFGNKIFHHYHKANLLHKDFEFYSEKFHNIEPHSGYWWPYRWDSKLQQKIIWEKMI